MGALWTGVSGLNTYGEGMAVLGNNIANINTIGFKKTDIIYDDLISQQAPGGTTGQIGKGVEISALLLNSQVGGMESTNEATDIAIQGEHGYYMVKGPDDSKTFYTRAGNFRFDKSGNLVDPNGKTLQGWLVDKEAVQAADRSGTPLTQIPTTGGLTDIQLSDLEVPALSTANVSVITNLDSQAAIGAKDATDPYFSMFKSYSYDSSNPNASPVSNASYSTSIQVYDSDGVTHDMTVYYSRVANNGGKDTWEYLVSMDPANDGRSTISTSDKAGVVMIGTMTFTDSGTLENLTAFTLGSNASSPTSLDSWSQASFSANGYPQFSTTFAAASNASPQSVTIGVEMGIKSSNASWGSSMPSTASGIGTNLSKTAGFDLSKVKNTYYSSTNYASSSYTLVSSQDGYGKGYLKSVSVDDDGVLSGYFSNGRTVELYVIGLADFTNVQGLHREGNNLFSATPDSGEAKTGRANTGVFDSIIGNTLETANVDMATEMVNMIITQRAFQSNSKVVTTADAMMQKALELKR